MQPSSDPTFRDFMTHLQSLTNNPDTAASYVDSYLASHSGSFPIVEDNIAHFVHKEQPGTIVGVGGDWNGFDMRKSIMTPIGGGLLHYQHEFEADARLDYFFFEAHTSNLSDVLAHSQRGKRIEMRSMLDPLNARTGESGFGPRSELAMPGYQRPTVTNEQPGIQHIGLSYGVIKSSVLKRSRTYAIYLPPAYSTDHEPYPSVYFQDGGDYLKMGKAATILTNLITSGAIPPLVAVFVPPVDREHEYNCDDHYVRFFCDELVLVMQHQYHLSTDPAKRAVIGPSLGGLISLYLGHQRPDIFGLVGAQSSAVKSINGLDTFDARIDYAGKPHMPLRLHLVMGSYEACFATDSHGRCRDLLTPVREFRTVLEQDGYAHRYAEHHQGHSWGLWRDCLADMLTYFFT